MSFTPRNILIIRFSAMGDVVLTVPVIQSLLKKYPNTKITLLTKPFLHPFFEGIPNITLHPVDLKGKHNGFLGLSKLVKELTGNQKFDAVIDLHSVIRTWIIGGLLRLKGIPVYRINKGRKEKKAFIQEEINHKLPHTTERYHAVFQRAGFDFSLKKLLLPQTAFTEKVKALDKLFTGITIGIAPFAAHKSKEWGIKNLVAFIEQINTSNKVNVFLFGGGKQEVEKLDELASNYTNVKSLAGQFNLGEEVQLLSRLSVFIGMDSGNTHIASLTGIPVLSIWGGTHPDIGFSALYQPKENSILPSEQLQKKCKYTVFGTSENQLSESPYFCIQTIKPQKVIDRLKEIDILEKNFLL